MNYRHAFHAGNFADVMKHVLLTRILEHLRVKPSAFRVIDTHAGTGRYDLSGIEAGKTLEWRAGVGLLDETFAPDVEELLSTYRTIVREVQARYGEHAYPGSPAITREMIRPQDRAVLVELHPDDATLLSGRFNDVPNMKVLRLDGWTALGSLVPPRERRGLVLIDPPYEESGELMRSVDQLARAIRKWETGIYALWYPIKDGSEIQPFAAAIGSATTRDVLRLELLVDRPVTPNRLNGCGLIVVNPPWRLAEEADTILSALAGRLGRVGRGSHRCEYIRTLGK